MPLPQLGAGHMASVTGSEGPGSGTAGGKQTILVGAAVAQVTSVTAELPDGRSFPGAVKTGRGFPDRAWIVAHPPAEGVHLVFRNASGNQVAVLGPAAPTGPPRVAQPSSGGVTVFRYPAGPQTPAGTVVGYLISGRVGFWSPYSSEISQVPADGQPALGGLFLPFAPSTAYTSYGLLKALGYAHANVARVVLHFADGGQVSTPTFAAGWPGSDIRLWAVSLPHGVWRAGEQPPTISVTGYDAAGHVVQRVTLGSVTG
jgi:hypothetical protein